MSSWAACESEQHALLQVGHGSGQMLQGRSPLALRIIQGHG